jgi:hypothetical protein
MKQYKTKQQVLERTNFPLSLYKLTVNNLVAMATMEHKQSKHTVEQSSPNKFEPQ